MRGASATLDSGDAVGDDWKLWWEANKYDFVSERAEGRGRVYTPRALATREQSATGRDHRRLRAELQPELLELTRSDDAGVRSAAAVGLARLGDVEATPRLEAMLQDGNFDVRDAALLALGVMPSGRSRHSLLNIAGETPRGQSLLDERRLSDRDRGRALVLAGLRGGDGSGPLIASLLTEPDPEPELLRAACAGAGLSGDQGHVQALVAVVGDVDVSADIHATALTALGRLRDPSATALLVEQLHARPPARRAAAAALGYVADSGSHSALERLADVAGGDDDRPTRHLAAISLGRIGGRHAVDLILDTLQDADGDTRPWLALALGLAARQDEDVAETTVDRLLDELSGSASRDTRGAVMIALGLSRSPRAVPRLVQELEQGEADLAGQAALGLGFCGHADAQRTLLEALASTRSPFVARQAAFALGLLGDPSAAPVLVELMRTTNHTEVARAAANGLAFLGDPAATGPLMELVRHEDARGLQATWAVAAVGQLLDTDRRPALSVLAAGDSYLDRAGVIEELLRLGY